MTTASDEEIDRLILSFATERFQKVAMIFSEVLSHFRQHGIETTDEALEDRLHALVDAGKLEAQGNLFRWRRSEVRLSDQAPASLVLGPQPETRRYVISVVAVFLASSNDPKEFDAWENVVVVRARGPRHALTQAIAMTRSVLDDPENVSALGYSQEPCLYAVIAHQEEPELPNGGPTWSDDRMALRWMTDLDEQDFEKLKNYDDLPIPLEVMYIDLHFD